MAGDGYFVTERTVTFYMTEKRQQKRTEIIETAFRVWGESSFRSTSLASVAAAMGLSKTALYRYFGGKQELLEAMEEYFIALYGELCDRVTEERRDESMEGAFEAYNNRFVRFFAEHGEYLRFAQIHFLKKPEIGDLFLSVTFSRNQDFFPAAALEREFGWRLVQIPTVTRFVFGVSNFLLAVNHFNEVGCTPFRMGVDELLEKNLHIVLQGMAEGPARDRKIPDFKAVEEACTISREDLPETDRIFRAVSEVVAEDGLWNTTVEKIAGRLGMTKSSLYFHFENRDQMLWKLIDRERHHLGRVVLEKAAGRDGFEEQLYGYMVLFLRYVWGRPEFLATMNWFRFQEFSVEPPSEDPVSGMVPYFRFIGEAMAGGGYGGSGLPVEMQIRLIHFLLMQEITGHFRLGNDIGQLFPVLRTLHQLILYGMEGV
jgi:AcrR family transcriptional regulator